MDTLNKGYVPPPHPPVERRPGAYELRIMIGNSRWPPLDGLVDGSEYTPR